LDDRNGVRTPMQWSDAPHAGFTAPETPADRLVHPVIDDDVYGYQRVNVAAQEADADSLLNWTRRALRVRRQHPAFGRGTLELLAPDNTAVLAYLRIHDDEVILALHNLSAEPQSVTLDLSDYAGRRLTDLFTGDTLEAPASGAWTLDLGRYGFRWLKFTP
jgi:maltose alpha-D-glucosyltransferase/alpha-amylase